LIVNGSAVIGTAERGGIFDRGTIWSLDLVNGEFVTLHHFNGVTDGFLPRGNVAFDGTTLYGTTVATIWSLNTLTGHFRKLHEFDRATQGDSPVSGLILTGNTLYGTNSIGGAYGDGTLWEFVIPEPSAVSLLLAGGICLYAIRR
jgi:hypothetical protein